MTWSLLFKINSLCPQLSMLLLGMLLPCTLLLCMLLLLLLFTGSPQGPPPGEFCWPGQDGWVGRGCGCCRGQAVHIPSGVDVFVHGSPWYQLPQGKGTSFAADCACCYCACCYWACCYWACYYWACCYWACCYWACYHWACYYHYSSHSCSHGRDREKTIHSCSVCACLVGSFGCFLVLCMFIFKPYLKHQRKSALDMAMMHRLLNKQEHMR